jgi:hypothetical protein
MPEHQQIQQSKKPDTYFQKQATPVIQTPLSNPYSIIQRAKINPKSLTHADVMQLQRTIGNRAVGRLLSSIGNTSTTQQATVQRQEIPEEEICPPCIQKQEIPEEEEPLQGKMIGTIQRQEIPEEEEPMQGKFESKPEISCPSCFAAPIPILQKQEISEEEEPMQGKMIETIQRQEIPEEEEPLQTKRENNTGMPDNLKAGVESLSGIDMSNVRVHYNSSKPVEVGALAYTQGTNIHVASGQERHLPHEAWHVVQQKQGRVEPTMQLKDGVPVNDDEELEHEADMMGVKAKEWQLQKNQDEPLVANATHTHTVVQRRLPPGETIEAEISSGDGMNSAYWMVYRLMHIEISKGHLFKAVDNTLYDNAFTAVNDIFPNNRFNADAYAALYAVNQKYSQVLPVDQSIADEDLRKLRIGISYAIYIANQCAIRDQDIEKVFGPDAAVNEIKATYRNVANRLNNFNKANFKTDYNDDDYELGCGGFTKHGKGEIHISLKMLKFEELKEDPYSLAVTLLHECCHEIDQTIIDHGYYDSPNFVKLTQEIKKTNAAHYEEVARRLIGKSRYKNQIFTPAEPSPNRQDKKKSPKPSPNRQDKKKFLRKMRTANEGLRKMWTYSLNYHNMLRNIASGRSQLPVPEQIEKVKIIKNGFLLPKTNVNGTPVITEFDLALMESTTNVLYRAQDAVNDLKSSPNWEELLKKSIGELALTAIELVGGFQGYDLAYNSLMLYRIRTVIALGMNQADPFPELEVPELEE